MIKRNLLYRIWKQGKMTTIRVDDGLVLRFTEVYDPTGTPIFEGDVVRVSNLYHHTNTYILVKYNKNRMGWNLGEFNKQGNIFHVIGNIYKNQELSKLL